MIKTIKYNFKKVISLVLVVAMIAGMNTAWCVKEVKGDYIDNLANCTKLTKHDYNSNFNGGGTFGYFLAKSTYFIDFGTYVWTEDGSVTGRDASYEYPVTNCFLYEEYDPDNPRKSLIIKKNFEDISLGYKSFSKHDDVKIWDELELFKNLEELTIEGINNIESIKFPSKLKKLTIKNCEFKCNPDISYLSDLEELVFTNNKRSDAEQYKFGEINGLSTRNNLNVLRIDGSKIDSISLAGSSEEKKGNLVFSAKGCDVLGSVNFGGYTLINGYEKGVQYAPSFQDCVSLDELTLNGLADKENQTLDISGCTHLAKINLCYKFLSAEYRLKVKATNVKIATVPNSEIPKALFSRTQDSALGLYTMEAVDGYYLMDYAKSNPKDTNNNALFDSGSSHVLSQYPSYVIPNEDVNRYSKTDEYGVRTWSFEFWKVPKREDYVKEGKSEEQISKDYGDAYTAYLTKWRNYESAPIVVSVGDQIDTKPCFYAEDGSLMNDITVDDYTVELTSQVKPTDTEISKYGGNSATYNVISYNDATNTVSVTAENPGIAYLKITANSSSGKTGATVTQKIIVINTIESITLEEWDKTSYASCEGADISTDGRVDTPTFYATYQTKYPSLVAYTVVTPEWELYKKDSNGVYNLESYTSEGISLCTSSKSNSTTTDATNGTVRQGYEAIIKYDAVGGEYIIRGKVCKKGEKTEQDGEKKDTYATQATENQDSCKLTVQNFWAKNREDRLSYRVIKYKDDEFGTGTESIEFGMSNLGGTFYSEEPEIVGNENNCLVLEDVTEESGKYKKYTLTFNPEKTSAEIAKFLGDKGGQDTCYVTVETYLGKSEAEKVKYTKTVHLAGKFNVSYQGEEGSIAAGSYGLPTFYYVPAYYSRVYQDRNTALNPVPKDGYDFGWYSEADNKIIKWTGEPLGDLSLKTTWAKIYPINYNLNKGTNDKENPADYSAYRDDITLMPASRKGCIFSGWYDGDNKITEISKDSGREINLAAKWELIPYSITYNLDGGKNSSENPSKYTVESETITFKDATKGGYKFLGWYDSNDVKVTEIAKESIGDVTLTAKWERSEEVHFDDKEDNPETNNGWGDIDESDKGLIDPATVTDTSVNITGVKNVDYTGSAATFDIRVYYGTNLLSEGTDYTVVYKNNINVPKEGATEDALPTVIVKGKGIYAAGKGSKAFEDQKKTFMINPVDLSGAVIENLSALTAADKKGNAKTYNPIPSVTLKGKALKANIDYSLTYLDAAGSETNAGYSEAGIYNIKITGTGNYKGQGTSVFTLADGETATLMNKVSITGYKTSAAYTGNAITLNDIKKKADSDIKLAVKLTGAKSVVTLTEGEDYTVSYLDNVEAGTATVIFAAKAENDKGLVGEKSISFKITGAHLSKTTIVLKKTVEDTMPTSIHDYTGTQIKLAVVVTPKTAGAEPLKEGTDYTLEYRKNITAGTATVYIRGINAYSGTVKKTFKIKAVDFSKQSEDDLKVTVIPETIKKNDKGKYTPDVKVLYKGRLLTEGKDYILGYKNNSKPGNSTEGKKAPTVVIKGKGNFAKTTTKTFDIIAE